MTAQVLACTRCILDTSDDPALEIDSTGVCVHCRQFDVVWENIPKDLESSQQLLDTIVDELRQAGQGRDYDCILGVSGGVDSTYLGLLLKQYELRPLLVHFDNGWNTELAVMNIQNMVERLGFDLMTYVIDWDDFKELQLAYIRASVIDIEALTDHAIYGAMYKIAIEHNIGHIISGVNVATEQVLPNHWIANKADDVNIKSIYKQFGSGRKITRYPYVDSSTRRQIEKSGIKIVNLLDALLFDVDLAKQQIMQELDWRPYGGKHFESIFTRFYQGYILPTKFGVTKRKAHLSNLICSGQMTREEALADMRRENYPQELVAQDKAFVLKKLGISEREFDNLMQQPQRAHSDFEQIGAFFSRYPFFNVLKPLWTKIRPLFYG